MNQSTRQLAIMKGVHFGVGDYGKVYMWFSTYVSECSAALQVLSIEQAVELLQAAGVDNVDKLNGKPCWVKVGGSLIQYDGPAKI